MTIQDKILEYLYNVNKEVSLDNIKRNTNLKKSQIYTGLEHLKNRKLISKRRIILKKYKPPKILIKVCIRKSISSQTKVKWLINHMRD
jgi:hypothetical protein